jgi:hypothetical protein
MLNELIDMNLVYADQNIKILALQFITAIVLSFIVRAYYMRFAAPMGNLGNIGDALPILAIVTFLVILVVKTSLALSLGLVGALSIVRFRTPIKEPMELAFIFIAIAIGLGTGAGKHKLTAGVILVLIAIDYIRVMLSKKQISAKTLLIDVAESSDINLMNQLVGALKNTSGTVRLSRLELGNGSISLVAHLDHTQEGDIGRLLGEIKDISATAHCTLFDNKPIW